MNVGGSVAPWVAYSTLAPCGRRLGGLSGGEGPVQGRGRHPPAVGVDRAWPAPGTAAAAPRPVLALTSSAGA